MTPETLPVSSHNLTADRFWRTRTPAATASSARCCTTRPLSAQPARGLKYPSAYFPAFQAGYGLENVRSEALRGIAPVLLQLKTVVFEASGLHFALRKQQESV